MGDLAEASRQHKELMFQAPDHRYNRAVPASYRLLPAPEMRKKLEADYDRISEMIFGRSSTFEEVIGERQ